MSSCKPALVDGQAPCRTPRNMESHGIHLVVFHILLHLLFRKPSLVEKCKLQLVTVKRVFPEPKNRTEFQQLYLPDAGEVVEHLFLLVLSCSSKKDIAICILRTPEVTAERLRAGWFLMELYRHRFGVMVLLALLPVNRLRRPALHTGQILPTRSL